METKQCFMCKQVKLTTSFRKYKSGFNKGQIVSYCNQCEIAYKKNRIKISPWLNRLVNAKARCKSTGNYGARGIKCLITAEEIKKLWFRDKAWLLNKPSIDRIDSNGNYTMENCRFIELDENRRRDRWQSKKSYKILKEQSDKYKQALEKVVDYSKDCEGKVYKDMLDIASLALN